MTETQVLRISPPGEELISLALLEKRSPAAGQQLRPVVLLHGATLSSALYDLPATGYSLMAELAAKGRAVYALDVRGYGRSEGGPVMNAPADEHAPFARAAEVLSDVAAAVDCVLHREGVAALDLVGFSWGTITAARYAGSHPEKIGRLVLYAPLYGEINTAWLERIADRDDPTRLAPGFGAYRPVTYEDVLRRWDAELPPGNPDRYREDGLPKLVFDALAALDPLSAGHRAARAFRCPNGALADLVSVFNGRPLYDPAALVMPTLLIRGADDVTSTESDALRLLERIATPDKHYQVIAPGSHFLCLERNRAKLYEALNSFLGFAGPGREGE